MSYEAIMPQESFFYEGKWTENTCNAFVDVLVQEHKDGWWSVDGSNDIALLTALDYLNDTMGESFSWDDMLAQHYMLKKRFLNFKALLEIDGVHWDRRINHVYAVAHLWLQILKANPFAKAFYHKGDAIYDKLEILFGSEHDISKEIVNISSEQTCNCEDNNVDAPILIADSDDEEEVNSPVITGRKPPRKRLFGSPGSHKKLSTVSLESTNGVVATAVAPKKDQKRGKYPARGFVPMKPNFGTTVEIVGNKDSSSCASSSPLKWFPSPSGLNE